MDPDQLAATQYGLAAHWQLVGAGLGPEQVRWWSRELRSVFPGVFVTGSGPITTAQRWRAATLTAPGSALDLSSAAALHGLRDDPPRGVAIVRPGGCGPERSAGLVVRYSRELEGALTTVEGIPVTTPERTVIDLWARLRRPGERERLVREALRLGVTTVRRLLDAIRAHRGRRGIASLRAFVQQYGHLPLHRCRSDAEAYALTILDDAGLELPLVNARIAGEEADLCWPGPRHILEIDGPQWHRFADVGARKTAAWIEAGYTVDRLPSPDLYADRSTLLRRVPRPNADPSSS